MNRARTVTIGALLGGAVCCGGVVAYVTSRGSGVTLPEPWLDQIIFGGLCVGFAVTLGTSQQTRLNVAVATVASVFSLYTAELALIVIDISPLRHHAHISSIDDAPEYDMRSPVQVLADLRATGQAAEPTFGGVDAVQVNPALKGGIASPGKDPLLWPLGGISNVLTVYCNESGEYRLYESDAYGFDNPRGSWDRPVDILVTGDSFAHGACVGPGQDVAGVLRRTGASVLNIGYAGFGPLVQLASIKEYGHLAKPQTLLWFFFEGNDVSGLALESTLPYLSSYLRDDFSQDLAARQAAIDEMWKGASKNTDRLVNEHSAVRRFLKLQAVRYLVRTVLRTEVTLDRELFSRIMTEAHRTAESWGARMYFVYLPEPIRFLDAQAYGGEGRFRDEILALTEQHGIPVIDFLEIVDGHDDPASLFPLGSFYGHYGEAGYELLAHTIRARLDQDERARTDE